MNEEKARVTTITATATFTATIDAATAYLAATAAAAACVHPMRTDIAMFLYRNVFYYTRKYKWNKKFQEKNKKKIPIKTKNNYILHVGSNLCLWLS